MAKREVRLAGGDGWPDHFAGAPKPALPGGRSRVLDLPPEEVVYYLERRIQQMAKAIDDDDLRAAKAPLQETMTMLAMTSDLPGDTERREDLRAVVQRLPQADGPGTG